MGYVPAGRQEEIGAKLVCRVPDPPADGVDGLHDVPPMNQETGGGRQEAGREADVRLPEAGPGTNLAAARKRLESIEGREYWRSIEELLETEDFREHLHREFRVPIDSGVEPPGAPVAHGRVDRAGRTDRLHAAADRADLPVRQGARGDRPGRGPLLRHGAPPRRLRARHPRQELRGPARQDRGQRAPSREPRRHRRLRAGLHPQHVRPGPVAGARPSAGRSGPGAPSSPRSRLAPREGAAVAGRGPALPDRHGHLADARGADRRRPGGVPGGEVGRVGAGRARERLRGNAPRLRRGRRAALRLRHGRRRPVARERLPGQRPVDAAPRARLRVAPPPGATR